MQPSHASSNITELTVHSLTVRGDGVARLHDGRVVFISGVLPGDKVRIRLEPHTKKGVQYAELLQFIEPSPNRTHSRCHQEHCGGCPLQCATPELQASLKREHMIETMKRIGGLHIQDKLGPIVQVGDGWHYRHRVRLHAFFGTRGWELGYYARRSHRVLSFAGCPVLWPELEKLCIGVARSLKHFPQGAHIREVEIAYSKRDARGGAMIYCDGPLDMFRQSLHWADASGLSGVEITNGKERFRYGHLDLRYDHARASQFDLLFEASSFTQAHPAMNDLLVNAVMDAIRPREALRVLELHAGIGNFTLPLARAGARIESYEMNARAVVLAKRATRSSDVHVTAHQAPDTAAIQNMYQFDAILLDPPRTGAKEVAQAIAAHGPLRVVYVSCDVATLARDVGILCQGGYTLRHIVGFDMFPQTPHVETLVVLEREA